MIPPIWGGADGTPAEGESGAGQPDPFPGNLGQGYGHGNHTLPPIWIRGQDHQLPKSVQPVAVSRTISPVTQVAEVAVKKCR